MKAPIPLAVLVGLSITAHAICPGFDFAIGNVIPLSEHVNRWNVYDDSCSVIDGLSLNSTGNPCNQRIFGCSPAPILFDQYTNTATGSTYACQRDPNSDVCGSDNISVCCAPPGLSVPSASASAAFATDPSASASSSASTQSVPSTITPATPPPSSSIVVPPSSSSIMPSHKANPVGIIAGGVVAGVVVVTILILSIVFWRRKRTSAITFPSSASPPTMVSSESRFRSTGTVRPGGGGARDDNDLYGYTGERESEERREPTSTMASSESRFRSTGTAKPFVHSEASRQGMRREKALTLPNTGLSPSSGIFEGSEGEERPPDYDHV